MTTDLDPSNPGGTTTSPRLSFSYDLSQSDTVPVEHLLRSCSSSSFDFNFCIQNISDHHQPSMADELFLDGKILPTPMKPKTEKHQNPPPPPPPEEEKSQSPAAEDEEVKQQNSKSFWGFKRSSSCGSGYGRGLCPVVLLSRSHSMGSSTSSKRTSSLKEGCNQKCQRSVQKSWVSQKPPLRKSGYGSYGNGTTGNGIRVSPVLNLGFGSFFSGNSKNKTKK